MHQREKRLLLLLLPMLLLTTNALAVGIQTLEVEANGYPVTYVSPTNTQLVDIRFTIDATRDYVLFDLSDLNTEIGSSYDSVNVPLDTCLYNATTNRSTCLISGIPLKPGGLSAVVKWEFWRGGGRHPGNRTLTFQADNSSPSVTSITTPICRDNKCFIGSGVPTNISIALEDSLGTFNQHLIFYKIGTFSAPVGYCDGTTCYGDATVSCGDYAALDMKVVNGPSNTPSQDDAGNPVTNPGEVTRVWCDAKAPRIINLTAKGTGMFDFVTNDGELIITAYIEEAVTRGKIIARTHDVQFNVSENESAEAACESVENDIQLCELSIGNLEAGRNKRVDVIIQDEVGHNATSTLVIPRILRVTNETTKPSFFSAEATGVLPEMINRVALQLAFDNAFEFPQFITYDIRRTTAGAKVLHQEIDPMSCEAVWEPESVTGDGYGPASGENWSDASTLYNEIRIFFPNANWDEDNRIDATFLAIDDVDELETDTILVRCNLSLTVERDDVLYTLPEQETLYWPLHLRNSALGSPGDAFLKKIDEQKEELEGGLFQLIGYAHQLMSTFEQLCQLQGIINALTTGGLTVENVGLLLGTTGIGQSIQASGSQATNAGLQYSLSYFISRAGGVGGAKNVGKGEDRGLGRQFCDFVYCDTARQWQKDTTEGTGNVPETGEKKWSQALEDSGPGKSDILGPYMEDLGRPQVENSIIMSLATQCWGGVVYNLNKYRTIECGYLQCLKDQALGGASITPCEHTRGAAICMMVMGEIFELPYARIVNNLMDNVQNIMQAPVGLLFNFLTTGPCASMNTEVGLVPFLCHVMQGLRVIEDFRSVTESSLVFTYDSSPDICQRALCEGDDCELTSSGLLSKFVPSLGGSGGAAAYRTQYLRDWRNEQNKRKNQELYEDLQGDPTKSDDGWKYSADATITPAMDEYADRAGIAKDPAARRNFFASVTGQNPVDTDNYCTARSKDACVADFAYVVNKGDMPHDKSSYDSANTGSLPASATKAAAGYQTYMSNPDCKAGKNNCLIPDNCEEGSKSGRCKDARDAQKTMEEQLKGYEIKDGKLCPVGKNGADCIDPATINKHNADQARLKNAQEWYTFTEGLVGVMAQQWDEEGKLDWMRMRGWGTFGEEVDAFAQDLPFTTTWQQSMCNPTGDFGSLTMDDGSVYAYQENTYRPVLTFAGERLEIGDRASGAQAQNLYTVSFVLISPFGTNNLTVTLEPGERQLYNGAVSRSNIPVSQGFSINTTTVYEKVCMTFTSPFPDNAGEKEYCRKIVENAYDRGVVTNGTLPDWGVDDPYSGYATSGASGTTNDFGLGGGMNRGTRGGTI